MKFSELLCVVLIAITAYLFMALRRALKRERNLIRLDPLTGVANRRAFYDSAGQEISRTKRYKHPFTLIYMDVDNLKMVNYRLGHATGDNLLGAVAKTLKGSVREVDTVSRFGGDEFAILLPETDAEASQKVITRLRAKLLDAMKAASWPTTFSFGATTFVTAPDSVEDMVKKASSMMYSAKDSGVDAIDQNIFEKG